MSSIQCHKCGKIQSRERIEPTCERCGAELDKKATPEPTTTPGDPIKTTTTKQRGFGAWLGITLLALLFGLVILPFSVGFVWAFFGPSETTAATEKATNDQAAQTVTKKSTDDQVTQASQPKAVDEDDKAPEAGSEKKSYGVGDDVQVGEVKWKVLTAPTKTREIGSEYSKEIAGGIFIVVELQAELTGKESGNVSSAQFAIIDSQDRKFEASSDASMGLVMEDKETFSFTQVNPNVPITGFVAFDLPEDATGLKLQIDDLRTFSDEHELVDLGI